MIKFRIWDNQTKKYIYENSSSLHCSSRFCVDVFTGEVIDVVSAISGDDNYVSVSENPKFYIDKGIVIGPRYEAERWTGCKDVNGVEIYEGDIVNFKLGQKEYFENVAWEDNCWRTISWFGGSEPLVASIVTVVGNMRENPHLLKEND